MTKYSSNAGQPVKEVEVLTLSGALALLMKLRNNGKVFRVDFFKKDGSARTMNCRFGVHKGVTGKGMAYNPLDKGLLTVWESGEGFKQVNIDTIKLIKYAGIVYLFDALAFIPKGTYTPKILKIKGRTVKAQTSPLYAVA